MKLKNKLQKVYFSFGDVFNFKLHKHMFSQWILWSLTLENSDGISKHKDKVKTNKTKFDQKKNK